MNTLDTSPKDQVLFWAFVIMLASISCYVRMAGVTQNGILGSDTFQYLDIAYMWDRGEFVLNNDLKEYRQYFRPTFYALNALALNLFGANDYSLRVLLGLAETLNVLLVLLLGLKILKSNWAALGLAVLYCCTPSTIFLSQIELPHTYTVTFTLLAFLSLVSSYKENQNGVFDLKLLSLAGLFAGFSATTHGSTAFFGPGYVLLIAAGCKMNSLSLKEWFRSTLGYCAIFTTLFFVPYVIFGAIVGFEYAARAILSESRIRGTEVLNSWELFRTYISDGPRLSISKAIMYSFWISTAYHLVVMLPKRRVELFSSGALLILGLFISLFSFVFQSVFYPRLFLPLNFFVLLVVVSAFLDLLRRFNPLLKVVVFYVGVGALSYVTIEPALAEVIAKYRGESMGGPRFAYNVLRDRISNDRRLLIAPYIQWVHRPTFKAPVYFTDKVSYLIECREGDVEKFLLQNKIKYIFVTKDLDQNILTSTQDRYSKIGTCWGMSKSEYTIEADQHRISTLLGKLQAKTIISSEEYGTIYEIPEL